jgi:starch-binding outer membrane protein, SusD/RagB family
MHNFLADNHSSPEIIFPVPFDGVRTRTWGGTTFLVNAAIGGSMSPATTAAARRGGVCGSRPSWWPSTRAASAGPTDVPIFYTAGQQLQVTQLSNFNHGYAAPKYRNLTSGGAPGSNSVHPDIDYPMFRLADAYLMYAELHLRGGGGSQELALQYVNEIRARAYGNTNGNITADQLTLQFVLDERARELFWEGHRRTDLIRYGQFISGDYLWAWKGGAQGGQSAAECWLVYPIPAAELVANPNLSRRIRSATRRDTGASSAAGDAPRVPADELQPRRHGGGAAIFLPDNTTRSRT